MTLLGVGCGHAWVRYGWCSAPGAPGAQPDFSAMLNGLNGLNVPGLGGGMPAAHPETANPEIAFASQLEQLQVWGSAWSDPS